MRVIMKFGWKISFRLISWAKIAHSVGYTLVQICPFEGGAYF